MDSVTKKTPFIYQVKNIFEHKKLTLKSAQRMIIMYIALKADKNGCCSLYTQEIANFIGEDKRSIFRHLNNLKKLRVISVQNHYQEGTKNMTKSSFVINIQALVDLSINEFGEPIITKSEAVGVTILPVKPQDMVEFKAHFKAVEREHQALIDGVLNENRSSHYDSISSSNIDHSSQGGHDKLSLGVMTNCHGKDKSNIKPIYSRSRDIDQTNLEPGQNVTNIPISNFDLFWASYPRKQGKQKALLAWHKKGLEIIGAQIIEDVITRAKKEAQWQNKEFVPHASTYLNGEHWHDEIIESQIEIAKQTNLGVNQDRANHYHQSNGKPLSKTAAAVIRGRELYEQQNRDREAARQRGEMV